MIRSNYAVLSILSFILSFTLLSVSIPSCAANYANWGQMFEGSAYQNGTHISMPYADVRINIISASTEIIVSLDSEFHIVTKTTQNATLAFVYPTAWGVGVTDESYNMHIYANGSLIDYTVVHYNSTTEGEPTEYFINDIQNLLYIDFAIFDIELTANTTMVLSTETDSVFSTSIDRFDYQYIVGSARTFEGHTLERVHMHVLEQVPFVSKSFGPSESLTVTESGIETDAIWDLNITEYPNDTVGFGADVYIYIDWRSTIGWTAIIVVLVLLYVFNRSKGSKN